MKELPQFDFQAGEFLLFNKPKTWSSFDVVKKVRGLVRVKKVGHGGTLDPLASGLMIICTGKKTKLLTDLHGLDKEYEVTFKLGATTASHDMEEAEENLKDTSHITREMVEEGIAKFRGEFLQTPPQFSAVKVKGKRAYESARKGKEIKLNPRLVNVYAFELLDYGSPEKITALVKCSKGTYIRTLIHDLGQELGVGGYITDLKRTAIGEYKLSEAWEIKDFQEIVINLRKSGGQQAE